LSTTDNNLEENTTMKDIFKTIIGGTIALAVVWGISQVLVLKTILRFLFFFAFWLIAIYSAMFYKTDWGEIYYDRDWLKLIVIVIVVVFWTVIFYYAFFYGIGMEKSPYYR
jgi:hypothetical protein